MRWILLKYLIVSQIPIAAKNKTNGAIYNIVLPAKGYFFRAEAIIARTKVVRINKERWPFFFRKI
ncbi:unnamed protein product [marine sediment metagenome]|uniref:Uncharacterized protein n=1 Tax=marine sediment metagenome TaxID=412755 RepID=X1LBF0_9ZZZZ